LELLSQLYSYAVLAKGFKACACRALPESMWGRAHKGTSLCLNMFGTDHNVHEWQIRSCNQTGKHYQDCLHFGLAT